MRLTVGDRCTADRLQTFIIISLETKISSCSLCSCVCDTVIICSSDSNVSWYRVSSLKGTPTHGLYVSGLCYTGCSVAVQRCTVSMYGVMERSQWWRQFVLGGNLGWNSVWRRIGNSVSCTYRPMCTSRHSTFCAHSIGVGFISWSLYNRTTHCAPFPSLDAAYRRRSGWRPQRQNLQTTQYRGEVKA